ncbi:MAG: hypothetical protein KDD89_10800, partial [Anaerolineales bacterium]|nr:hypothetical protein [Anaerolineales bacterium]
MPVFTAFGWAGEDTALKFAITQLELFINTLHRDLSREGQQYFPFCGLDKKTNTVYLASQATAEEGVFITFSTRPMFLNMTLSILNKSMLDRGYEAAQEKPDDWHRLITQLGNEWSVHFQQQQVDEESGEIASYQDLFKDGVTAFDPQTAESITSRAAFLNSEDRWVIPFHLSRRYPSEQIAIMKGEVTAVLSNEINKLLSIIDFFESRTKTRKSKRKPKSKTGTRTTQTATEATTAEKKEIDPDSFIYLATLKPLHIRKGFINLTTKHWPFFALNARAGSRPVTIYFDGRYDKEATVWRLQPSEMARIVLGHT